MIITITVKNFEDKSTERGAWYVVIDEKDKAHNIFSSKVPDLLSKKPLLNIGHTVELVKTKTEKGWDTVDITAATAQQAVNEDKSASFASQTIERKAKNRISALSSAIAFHSDTSKTVPMVLETAERFLTWLEGGVKPVEAPPAQPQEATKPQEDDLFPEEVAKAPTVKTQPKLGDSSYDLSTPDKLRDVCNDLCVKAGLTKAKDLIDYLEKHKELFSTTSPKLLTQADKIALVYALDKETKK